MKQRCFKATLLYFTYTCKYLEVDFGHQVVPFFHIRSHVWTLYKLYECSITGDVLFFWFRAAYNSWMVSNDPKHASFVRTCLLPEKSVFGFIGQCKLWLVRYISRHASRSLSGTTYYAYFNMSRNHCHTCGYNTYHIPNNFLTTKVTSFHAKSNKTVTI